MVVFDCGDAEAVMRSLDSFIEEMDERGDAYGYSGEAVLSGDHGLLSDSTDQQVLLVLGGEGTFETPDTGPVTVRAGQGVFLEAGERWRFRWPHDREVRVLQADGPSLRLAHFASH